MKIKRISGCICDSLTIDGIETIDMNGDNIKDAIKKIIDSIKDLGVLQSTLIDLVECLGDWKDIGTCEQCGDTITEYTLKL